MKLLTKVGLCRAEFLAITIASYCFRRILTICCTFSCAWFLGFFFSFVWLILICVIILNAVGAVATIAATGTTIRCSIACRVSARFAFSFRIELVLGVRGWHSGLVAWVWSMGRQAELDCSSMHHWCFASNATTGGRSKTNSSKNQSIDATD